MEKFERYRRDLDEYVECVASKGMIKSISPIGRQNSNGKLFFTFTADVEMPGGGNLGILGQVYESAFDFLGNKPEVGEEFLFATELAHIMAKNNKLWYIAGHVVDEITEDVIDEMENLF